SLGMGRNTSVPPSWLMRSKRGKERPCVQENWTCSGLRESVVRNPYHCQLAWRSMGVPSSSSRSSTKGDQTSKPVSQNQKEFVFTHPSTNTSRFRRWAKE